MKKILTKKNIITALLAILVYALVYVLISQGILSRSMQSIVLRMCYNIVLAVSLCLVVGFLGELSLGHAGFYAIGGYAGCIFAVNTTLPVLLQFIIALIIGGVVAAIGGFLISSSILRLKGDYLAIVTLAFGEVIRSFLKIIPGTGGTSGLNGIPSLGNKAETFLPMFAVVLLVILLSVNFVNSRHGRAITAIRDNAIAAQSVGINLKNYKILTFTIAACFAGMAGVMFGFFKSTLEPTDFHYNVSIEILVMVVLGGMASIRGSVISACVITALPELLREASQYRLLLYAIALIVMMLLGSSPRFKAFKDKFYSLGAKFIPKAATGRKEG